MRSEQPRARGARRDRRLPRGAASPIHVRGEIDAAAGALRRARTIAADPFTIAGDTAGLRVESLRLRSDALTMVVSGRCRSEAIARSTSRAGRHAARLCRRRRSSSTARPISRSRWVGPWPSPQVAGWRDRRRRRRQVRQRRVAATSRSTRGCRAGRSSSTAPLGGSWAAASSARGEAVIEEPIEASDVELAIDLRQVDLVHIASDLASGPRPYLVVDAEATLQASEIELASVGGWIDLISVRAGAEGNDMTTLEPTRILIEEGRATLPELHLVGGGTDLRLEGETSLATPLDDVEARVHWRDRLLAARLSRHLAARASGRRHRHHRPRGPPRRGGIELEGGGTIVERAHRLGPAALPGVRAHRRRGVPRQRHPPARAAAVASAAARGGARVDRPAQPHHARERRARGGGARGEPRVQRRRACALQRRCVVPGTRRPAIACVAICAS